MTPWQWAVHDTWQPLPPDVPDWEPTQPLHLRRSVQIDLTRLTEETRLDPDARLALTVSWISSTTAMRGAASPVSLDPTGATTLDVTLPGDRIGGTLDVRTTLTLLAPTSMSSVGVAQLPGSVLLEDRHRLVLDHGTDRFPVHEIDFAATRLDPHASWHLETTTELNAPFLGSFLLLLNKRDTELTAAVVGGRKNPRQEAIVDELEHGVAALLLELAAHLRIELAERDDWLAGTVGDTLARVLRQAERTGAVPPPTGPHVLAHARTRISAAVRAAG
ncbi:MAG: hypothetical protein ACRDTJ_30740, partial [Pseudonocardiaceae bacterium]